MQVSLMSGCIAVTAMYRAVFHNAGTRASFRCWLYPDSWNNSFGGTVLRLEPLAKDKHAYMVQMQPVLRQFVGVGHNLTYADEG